ncbi:hypothetical protein CRG98_027044 [Punica granatum]|uniref:Uncharacterized protein n=1 Tax=Punica granatum TaxID=22663 RepID=A0A2I0J8J1_PUNGR|nr:hypothetical protein CRG98_027044 [Punica granatum]
MAADFSYNMDGCWAVTFVDCSMDGFGGKKKMERSREEDDEDDGNEVVDSSSGDGVSNCFDNEGDEA